MIDNLDRCLPANAIQTLEAIRLFLFLNRTAFIIAADEEIVRLPVAEHYKICRIVIKLIIWTSSFRFLFVYPKQVCLKFVHIYICCTPFIKKIATKKLASLRQFLETHLQQSWKSQSLNPEEVAETIEEQHNQTLLSDFERAKQNSAFISKFT